MVLFLMIDHSQWIIFWCCNLTTQKPATSPVKPKDSSTRIGKLQVILFYFFESKVFIPGISLWFLLRKTLLFHMFLCFFCLGFHIPACLWQQHTSQNKHFSNWFTVVEELLFLSHWSLLFHFAVASFPSTVSYVVNDVFGTTLRLNVE